MGCASSTESNKIGENKAHESTSTNDTTISNRQSTATTVPSNTTRNTSAEADTGDGEFKQQLELALAKHNEYRALHGSPPMNLDTQLCRMAQEYAEHISRTGKMEHAKQEESMINGEFVGENLSWSMGYKGDHAVMATESWYSEIKDYNWDNQEFAMNTGHFTQVVWKTSSKLGIGIAENAKGEVTVVGRYYPAGNMMGDFEPNVPRLLD